MNAEQVRCDRPDCRGLGPHRCLPRAQRVIDVFERVLVHTKGRWARQPFILEPWQREGIIVPVFGDVEWSEEYEQWVRRYQLAWLEVARKNGKSELLAGIAIVLLVADDEEGAEVYGAAQDREQARKVYDVAERMVELSPHLSKRLHPYVQSKRIVDPNHGGVYQIVSSDAPGNLGHNPSGVVFDEVLTQPDDGLWTSFRTATGTRAQMLMVAATTAGNDQESFAYHEHEFSEKVWRDPELEPRRFVFMRNTPMEADPFEERNWHHANPALGSFLSLQSLRDAALEARNDPVKEVAFRQFRLDQWVRGASRWMPMHLWDLCVGPAGKASTEELDERVAGQRCWGGLDLSAKYDLTALCWLFPALNQVLWRFWLPEEQVPVLDRLTGGAVGQWVQAGWIVATPGATIDYGAFYDQVDADRERFAVQDLNYDPLMAAPIIRELESRGLQAVQVSQGFALSEPIKEVMRRVQARELVHGGNPVARWNAECVEVKQDNRERLFLVKPRRGATGKRIDGIVALVMAVDGVMRRGNVEPARRRVFGW
jgi:phage terminase large subunit-like protein